MDSLLPFRVHKTRITLDLLARMRDADVDFKFVSGAIFREDQRNSHYDLAFKFAVHKINQDQHILSKTSLIYDIQYVKADDSFHANKQGDCSVFCSASIGADCFQ